MMPLDGCRVLDLGIITAGAATSAMLADLGAEVIKVESAKYLDPFRVWTSGPAAASRDDLPPFFRMTNRGKLSLSLNLKDPAGRDTFLRLVAQSDIVVENFSRGVLQRLGIDYPALCRAKPDIILASISSQGETGPDANYVSFGSTLEAVGGTAWLTGYRDGPPAVSGLELNYPDQVVALFASGIIAAAWRNRRATGKGALLDLSQRELTLFLSGEAFATARERAGNEQAPYAVQDCLLCSDGAWVAVSLQQAQLGAVAGLTGAKEGQAPIDALAGWAAALPSPECAAQLRQIGAAVSPVLNAKQVLDGIGTDWRLAMQAMPDGQIVKGCPFQFDEEPIHNNRPARQLGADTIDVLTRVGGLSEAEIRALTEAGIAEVTPAKAAAAP